MKKPIDIEKLLKWTYCDELPKGGGSGAGPVSRSAWSAIESYVQLLTKVDDNKYGVVPTLSDLEGDPHPDALKVHEAVTALDDLELDLPEGWNPMPELDAFGEHGVKVLKTACLRLKIARLSSSDLLRKHAILGGTPDWNGTVPELVVIKNRQGGDAWYREVVQESLDLAGNPVTYRFESEDGWCFAGKKPKRGAYRKFFLKPDPVPVLIGRGEYQFWLACMVALAENLKKSLTLWDVTLPRRTAWPWLDSDGYEGRVLPDLKRPGTTPLSNCA